MHLFKFEFLHSVYGLSLVLHNITFDGDCFKLSNLLKILAQNLITYNEKSLKRC